MTKLKLKQKKSQSKYSWSEEKVNKFMETVEEQSSHTHIDRGMKISAQDRQKFMERRKHIQKS